MAKKREPPELPLRPIDVRDLCWPEIKSKLAALSAAVQSMADYQAAGVEVSARHIHHSTFAMRGLKAIVADCLVHPGGWTSGDDGLPEALIVLHKILIGYGALESAGEAASGVKALVLDGASKPLAVDAMADWLVGVRPQLELSIGEIESYLRTQSEPEPLTENETAADHAIRGGCDSLKQIAAKTGIPESSLSKYAIPGLKAKRGLLSKPYRYE